MSYVYHALRMCTFSWPINFLFLDLPHVEHLPNQTNTCEGAKIIMVKWMNYCCLLDKVVEMNTRIH